MDEFWNSVKENTVGIDNITRFDTTDYKVKLAAEVKDFDAKNYMDFKAAKRMEKFSQYAVAAAHEAMKDSGLDMAKEDAFRVGVSVGSGVGSLEAMESNHKKLLEKGPSRINPLLVPLMITNMAAGNVSIQLGLKGKNINVVTACATGTNSIGEGYRSIQHGEADVMFAGGTESSISPIGIGGFAALTALSTSTDPKRASIPFDKERNGFVMGEGAGMLVLEELEHAKARGAHIYCEMVGYGVSCDAYHMTAPAPEGIGGAKAMINALQDASLEANQIDYINAHGTSTPMNDKLETAAIKKAFKNHAHKVAVSSTKGNTGHCLGAAGGIEGETLLLLLDAKGIAASSGSACTSGSLDPSHVLLAIGRPHEVAHGSLRLTIAEDITEEQIDYMVKEIKNVVDYLRSISPVWDELQRGEQKHVI